MHVDEREGYKNGNVFERRRKTDSDNGRENVMLYSLMLNKKIVIC